jgi:hypothetical protein
MKTTTVLISIFATLFVSLKIYAATSTNMETPDYEVVCRAQAKEIATQTYRTCINDNKTAEIEKIKREFQDKLKTLKSEYENEINRLGGKVKPANSVSNNETTKSTIPQKRAKRQNKSDLKSDTRPELKSEKASEKIYDSPELSVQLKTVVPASSADESSMDLPDPVPVTE